MQNNHALENKNSGFTLAEVLITLGIIGVVAAMTLPGLVQKQQKKQTAVALEKFYSSFQNAINLSQVDNGPYQNWDTTMDYNNTEALYNWFDQYIIKYMKLLTNCNESNNKKCFQNYSYCILPNSCTSGNALSNSNIMYIFQDGSTIIAITGGGVETSSRVFHIRLDTNGFKKPNTLGKDIFSFRYEKGKIRCDDHKSLTGGSVSAGDSRDVLIDACKNNPQTCTCLIMHDGWEIKNDYPW